MADLLQRLLGIRDASKRRALLQREGLPPAEIDALLERAHILLKGRDKFPRAAKMRFDREGLAQASAKAVAEHRTWRLRERLPEMRRVLDACAGVGGDTIALATRWPVLAVERDPETLAMLRHNVGVYGLAARVEFIEGDIRALAASAEFRAQIGDVDCIFFDPSRRGGGSRKMDPERYEPPLTLVETLRGLCPNVCVKVSPMLAFDDLPGECDVEVVSHKGAVKETVLWFGALRADPQRTRVMASKLPERITWTRSERTPQIPVSEPGRYLYEPDPAFIRAHLIEDVAERFGLRQLDRRLAYLTSDERIDDPILERFHVLDGVEPDDEVVSARLVAAGIGRVDFKARGVAVDLRRIHEQVKGRGKGRGLVVFTRVAGLPRALICRYDSRR